MRITLFGVLVVLGVSLLLLYALKVHQEKNSQGNGTGVDDRSRFPDGPSFPSEHS
jgi:hypothetical protein